jgi:hypothetical protein
MMEEGQEAGKKKRMWATAKTFSRRSKSSESPGCRSTNIAFLRVWSLVGGSMLLGPLLKDVLIEGGFRQADGQF